MTTDLNPILKSARLILEPQHREHAALILELMSDARIHEFIPSEPPKDLDALTQRFEQLETRVSSDGTEYWLNWIVFHDATAVGRVEATVQESDLSASIAYLFHPRFWGQGFAVEACQTMLEHLHKALKVDVFTAYVDTRNVASQRLLEKLDFQQVEHIENADHFKGSTSHEFVYKLEVQRV